MLTEGALLIAAALVLGYLPPLFELPQGGSVNLEMIPICLFIIRWGLKDGLIGCTAFGILSVFVQGAVGYGWVSILLDYVVAFGVVGIGGIFRGKVVPATVLGFFCRFVIHFISGITVYKILVPTELFGLTFVNPWIYSLAYNGSYIVIDLIICLVVFAVLSKTALKKYLTGEDLQANEKKTA